MKAKRILVGADVQLRGYQAARKVENDVIGVVKNFRPGKADVELPSVKRLELLSGRQFEQR